MAIINNLSAVVYNGYTFPAILTSSLQAKPVLDDASRMTKWVEFTLNIRSYLVASVAGTKVDTIVNNLLTTLTANGGTLALSNKGFGTSFTVNTARGPKDVNYGPKVTKFHPRMFGDGYACLLEWECTFCLPECAGSVTQKALMMACYTVSYDIDHEGLSTVTTTGAIEIPLNFGPGHTLPDNADNYWDDVAFPIPEGFRRETNHRTLSADRRRLDFNVVDKQLHTALPNGCTEVELSQEIINLPAQSARIALPNQWRLNFSGRIKTGATWPKILALGVFLQFVLSRLAVAIAEGQRNKGSVQVFPGQLRIRENVTSYETTCSYTIDLINTQGFLSIINESGLFRSINYSHIGWLRSLANEHDPRGLALFAYANVDDTLLDLCSKNVAAPVTKPGAINNPPIQFPPPPPTQTYPPTVPPNLQATNNVIANAVNNLFQVSTFIYSYVPPPETSWMSWECYIDYKQDHRLVRMQPLSGQVGMVAPPFNPLQLNNMQQFTGSASVSANIQPTQATSTPPPASAVAGVTTTTPDRIQRLAAPATTVRLWGVASRLAYPIVPPRLLTFDGRNVQQNISQTFVRYGTWQNSSGIAVNFCAWSIEYLLTTPAQNSLAVPANPQQNINGSGG